MCGDFRLVQMILYLCVRVEWAGAFQTEVFFQLEVHFVAAHFKLGQNAANFFCCNWPRPIDI